MDFICKHLGLLFSFIYALLVGAYIYFNFDKFCTLAPNELGDFGAGAVGPIAIFWLVLGYYQQGEALKNQIQELTKTVKHQGEIAKVEKERLALDRSQIDSEKKLHEPTFSLVSTTNVYVTSYNDDNEVVHPEETSADFTTVYSFSVRLLSLSAGEAVSEMSIIGESNALFLPTNISLDTFDDSRSQNISFLIPLGTVFDTIHLEIKCFTRLKLPFETTYIITNDDPTVVPMDLASAKQLKFSITKVDS